MKQYYWYKGQLVNSSQIQISLDNPGLLYGATVFTTLRVYEHNLDHHLTDWSSHCERVKNSLNFFGWNQPDWKRVRNGAELLQEYFPVLRITIFPDGGELITGRVLPQNLPQMQTDGIAARMIDRSLYRSFPQHKTGNYLAAWWAKISVCNSQPTCQEAILIDEVGNWLETSTGNLWGWGQGCWWTPPLTGKILPGIGRSHIYSYLQTQNQTIRENPWTPEIINKLETLAYTNSVVEIIPIHTVIHPCQQLQYNPYHASLEILRRFFTT